MRTSYKVVKCDETRKGPGKLPKCFIRFCESKGSNVGCLARWNYPLSTSQFSKSKSESESLLIMMVHVRVINYANYCALIG
jgi:hypothetical protein